MPLTQEQKLRMLKVDNLDPSKWDVSEDGSSYVPKPETQPSTSSDIITAPIKQKDTTSTLGAIGAHALESTIPTAGGFGAAAGTGALLGSPLGPIGAGIGALISGIAASYGLSKAQSALMPDAARQYLAKSGEEHPIASTIGGFVPAAASLNVGKGIQDLASLPSIGQRLISTGRSALSTGEKQMLQNLAINTGIGAGQDIAEQTSSDQPFDYGKLATTIGLSAALGGHPTFIGKGLRLHAPAPDQLFENPARISAPKANIPEETTIPSQSEKIPLPFLSKTEDTIHPETGKVIPGSYHVPDKQVETIFNRQYPSLAEEHRIKGEDVNEPDQIVKLTTQQKREFLAQRQQEAAGSGGDLEPNRFDESTIPRRTERDIAYDKALAEKNAQDLAEQRKAKAELDRQEASQLASENAARALELKQRLEQQQVKAVPPPKPIVTTETGKEFHPDYTGNIEHDITQNTKAPETEAERIQREYDKGIRHSSELPNNSILTPEQRRTLERQQEEDLRRRGITPNVQHEVLSQPNTQGLEVGKPVGGYYGKKERIAHISQSWNSIKVRPHEGGHGFLHDLESSTNPIDNKLAKDGLAITGGDEEKLAESFSQKVARRNITTLYGGRKARFNQWWNDVKNHLGSKLGGKLDVEEHLANRYLNDSPYGTRAELYPSYQAFKGGSHIISNTETGAPNSGTNASTAPVSASNELHPNTRITVQHPSGVSGDKGYVQVDYHDNSRSTNPETLKAEGYNIPSSEELKKLPQGQYKLGDIVQHSGEPKNYGHEIEQHLGEASFKAAQEAQKENAHLREVKDSGLPIEEPYNATKEAMAKAHTKASEVEAFTRPDIERHSSEPRQPKSLEELNYKIPSAGWIHPNGKIHEVLPNEMHDTEAKRILKANHGEDWSKVGFGDPKGDATDRMKSLGYLRMVNYADTIAADNERKSSPTTAQKRTLEDAAIFNDRKHYFYNDNPSNELYSKEPKQEVVPGDSTKTSFIRPFEGQNDRVRKIDAKVAHAGDLMEQSKDLYEAKFIHDPMAKALGFRPTTDELNRVGEYMHQMYRKGESDITLNPKEQKVLEVWKPVMQDAAKEANKSGLLKEDHSGNFRKGSESEWYFPAQLNDKTIEDFTKRIHTPETEEKISRWADHAVENSHSKLTKEEALKNIRAYVESLGGRQYHNIEFGPMRKAAGYGVPDEMRETNFIKAISKYGRRAAADLAYWKHLQSDPYVAARLGLPKREGGKSTLEGINSIAGHPDVQGMMKILFGDFNRKQNQTATSFIRASVNSLLGTATGIRNTVQVPSLFTPYLQSVRDVGAFFKAFSNLREAKRDSITYGARSGSMDLDRWNTHESPNKFAENLNKIAEVARKYSGRDLMEQSDRIYSFAVGKELAKTKLYDSMNHNQKATKWLEQFNLGIDKPISEYGEHELNLTAKNIVDRTQGTYDSRGLPVGVFDSQYAPFFSLSRWAIEKSNTIWKDVMNPAITGKNYLPLLTYTLGTVLSGAAIRKLNELMSGKKDYTPSLSEANAEDNKSYYVAALVNLMQQGSYMGIVGDTAKVFSDTFLQHELPRGPVSFPAADFLTQTLGKNLSDWGTAMENGGGIESTFKLISNIAKSSIQNYRMLDSKFINSDETERQNKFRDLRTFNKLEGEEVPPVTAMTGNPLDKLDERKFKHTGDLDEAAKMLPSLISDAIEKSKGDPYKLKRELNNLKENNYQTFPNMEKAPLSFVRYITYLTKTQGADVAQERLTDYLLQNAKNQAKSSMVPSL